MYLKRLYLLLLAGPSSIEMTLRDYVLLLAVSMIVGKFLGAKRYIGFVWSSVFFFFMPLLGGLGLIFSLTVILLSPKLTSSPPKGTSRNLYWAVGLIILGGMGTLGMLLPSNNTIEIQAKQSGFRLAIELLLLSSYLIWIYKKFSVR